MKIFLSKIMGYWSALGHIIGAFMTPIHMFIVYGLVFGPSKLIMSALGKDPLDRTLRTEPTFWRKKEAHAASLQDLRHTF
jgi:phosphotransferase system  glucose/maltose/N-acetylglucosamine-specific IIC component